MPVFTCRGHRSGLVARPVLFWVEPSGATVVPGTVDPSPEGSPSDLSPSDLSPSDLPPERPPPDPAKLLGYWMEWERAATLPGRVMANLKTAGLRELLESLADPSPAGS